MIIFSESVDERREIAIFAEDFSLLKYVKQLFNDK